MPYTKENLPDAVKALPSAAQDIWLGAFNGAFDEYGGDEGKSNATAWSAVEKAGFHKDKEGKWMKEEVEEKEVNRGNERLRNSEILEMASLGEAQEVEPHVYRVQLMNLEDPQVKVKGWSANGKYYTDKALESLAKLLNNKKAMASGHHDNARLSETAGIYKEVVKIPGKKIIEGNFEVLGEAQKWLEPLIREQIKTPEANLVSLSINAGGSYFWGEKSGKRGKIVEDARYAESCDVVFDAAAGGNFKKIIEEYRRSKVDKITLQELKEDRPELVEEILKESKTKIDTLSVEVEKLKEEKKLQESKDLAETVIKESKLTEVQCGDGLRERMYGKTKEGMQKVIEDRKNFLRSFAPPQLITNLSEKAPESGEPEVKPLTETEKAVCKQLNLTEEKFRTLGKREKPAEKKDEKK